MSIEEIVAQRAVAMMDTPATAVPAGPRRVRVSAPTAESEFAFECLDLIDLPTSGGRIQVTGRTAVITW